MRIDVGMVLLMLFAGVAVYGSDEHEKSLESLRDEISDYRTRTDEIRKKIDHIEKKSGSDSLMYSEYVKDYRERANRLETERDSLQAMAVRLSERRDSLHSSAQTLKIKTENVSNRSASVNSAILDNCSQLIDSLMPLKIYNIDKQISAVRFLEGEMRVGTVGSIEALERYWQIVNQVEEASQRVESWTGPSPVGAIKGEVTFLRLGFVWLACVNKDNTEGLIRSENEKKWIPVKSPVILGNIQTAIKLSAGRFAPKLVSLPFNVKFSTKKAEK